MAEPGWELIRKSVGKEVSSKRAVLIAFTHWRLLVHGAKCIGVGEFFEDGSLQTGSESLPVKDWHNGEEPLKYTHVDSAHNFVLRTFVIDGGKGLMVTLTRATDGTSWAVSLNMDQLVDENGQVREMNQAKGEVDKLMTPMKKQKPKEDSSSSSSSSSSSEDFDPNPPAYRPPSFPGRPRHPEPMPPFPPFNEPWD